MKHEITTSDLAFIQADAVHDLYKLNQKKIGEYIDQLLWWNKKINLVSRDVSRETIEKHIVHSLVISQSPLFLGADTIIDSGTGGGLPGIPLAIAHPDKWLMLNDVVSKKILACKQIVSKLQLRNVESADSSIEKMDIKRGSIIVSKHAFKIDDLIKMTHDKPWAGVVLLKGAKEIKQELRRTPGYLKVDILNLEPGFQHEFYTGKALVEIQRKED